jgi:hypothetical protein
MWRRIDVSEEYTASIFKVKEYYKQQIIKQRKLTIILYYFLERKAV